MIVDGAKALDTAVTQTFGRGAVVQRCQVHKGRNILEHLPEAQRPWVTAILRRAYTHTNVQDCEAPVTGPGAALGHRLPECGCERARRPRRDADRAGLGSVGASPTLAGHDERHRESAQSHAPCETKCETLARRDDGAALGGRRRARSRKGVPSGERVPSRADATFARPEQCRTPGEHAASPHLPWRRRPADPEARRPGSIRTCPLSTPGLMPETWVTRWD